MNTANSHFWSRPMTVNLREGNGTETTLHLSMATVVAFTTSLVIAIMGGIIIWIFALQSTVTAHESKLAVMVQIDSDHKGTLEELKVDIKEMKPHVMMIPEIRKDQIRREKREK